MSSVEYKLPRVLSIKQNEVPLLQFFTFICWLLQSLVSVPRGKHTYIHTHTHIRTYIHTCRQNTDRRSHTYLHIYTWASFLPPPPLASYFFHLVFGSYIHVSHLISLSSVAWDVCGLWYWLFQSNPFLLFHVESSVYLHAAKNHFSNLLEAESSSGYSCSFPLNIIISVDNYTLQNRTEQG